jgi:hypothetical protein
LQRTSHLAIRERARNRATPSPGQGHAQERRPQLLNVL